MSATTDVRVLPADVYDALELVAEVFGGIGAGGMAVFGSGNWSALIDGTARPNCAIGAAYFLDGNFTGETREALRAVDITTAANDNAVARLNRMAGREQTTRVSFADWCAELHIVRGEA